jgi:hypothetical protein
MGRVAASSRVGPWISEYAQINQVGYFGPDSEYVDLDVSHDPNKEYVMAIKDGLSGVNQIGVITASQIIPGNPVKVSFLDSGNAPVSGSGLVSDVAAFIAKSLLGGIGNVFDYEIESSNGSFMALDPKTKSFKKKYVGPAGGDTYFLLFSRFSF